MDLIYSYLQSVGLMSPSSPASTTAPLPPSETTQLLPAQPTPNRTIPRPPY